MECGIYFAGIPPQPDNLVLCAVPDEAALIAAQAQLQATGIPLRLIIEPDMGNQATALCSAPLTGQDRRAFKSFPLWKPQHALMPQRLGGAPHAAPSGATPDRSANHALVA